MTKKKTMKNIKTPNKFSWGGEFKSAFNSGFNGNSFKDLFSGANMGKAAAGALPGIATGVASIASNAISNGFQTTGGDVLSGLGGIASMIPGIGLIAGPALEVLGGIIDRGFGTKWNNESIAEAESNIQGLNTFQSGASDYDTLAQDFNRIGSMNKTVKASDLGEDGWFVNRTQTKANKLNTDLGNAYNYAMRNVNNVADNISNNTLANLERNYAAFGGPIDTAYVNSRPANFVSRLKDKNRRHIRDWEDPRFIATHKLGAEYDENGIPFIYPAVQEINGQLVDFTRPPYTFEAGIESAIKNRDTVQMRSLEDAINFTKHYKYYYPKFAYGGQTHGADFTNGLMFINNGGTHESNPYEGVPISMDQEGNPNLVEEGEIIWNDYVFSNRLKIPKSIRKKYKLGKREMTFANAVDKLSRESEERPNDPISMRGLESILINMAIEQETFKNKRQSKNTKSNKFAIGGPYIPYSYVSGYNNGWFGDDGKYTKEYLDYVNSITKEQMLNAFNDNFAYYSNDKNKGTDRYKAIEAFYKSNPTYAKQLSELSDDMFNTSKGLMIDNKPGYMHHVAATMMNRATPIPITTPEGLTASPTVSTDLFKSEKLNRKRVTIPSNAYEKLPTWMRYAPAVGFGALALSDALGITNRPDYSNADAVIKTVRDKATYDPIRFKPIGDYLAYNPFDTEYHANQLRAVAGANRKYIMNTSGGNRATAMAGILASDNNTMNQLGDLYRKAAEYNLEQRQKVADFNKATNITNSEGFYKADAANQSAALQARGLGLEGLMKGYTMREQAKLMSDQARAANISGLFTNLGNIGYENANRNMANWSIANGTWAPSQWTYDPFTGKSIKSN